MAGIVRLLNTADGRALCLAGAVDPAAVEAFQGRYGHEPVRIDLIDAGSVTSLSEPGLELLLDHLETATRSGREVPVRRSATVDRALRCRSGRNFSR